MLSRVADAVYWMTRYIERAENVARFIDVNQAISLGGQIGSEDQWAPLIYASGDDVLFDQLYGSVTRSHVLRFLMFDRYNPNSILSCVTKARENARTIRDILSTPMWEAVNRFYLRVREGIPRERSILEHPHDFLERVKRSSHQGCTLRRRLLCDFTLTDILLDSGEIRVSQNLESSETIYYGDFGQHSSFLRLRNIQCILFDL